MEVYGAWPRGVAPRGTTTRPGAIQIVTHLTGEERIFRGGGRIGPMTEGKTRLSATYRDYGDAQRPTAWLGM